MVYVNEDLAAGTSVELAADRLGGGRPLSYRVQGTAPGHAGLGIQAGGQGGDGGGRLIIEGDLAPSGQLEIGSLLAVMLMR